MAIHSYTKPSVNNVPEYQLSGVPYAKKIVLGSGASDTLSLPRVSRWVVISCATDIEIAFSSAGITGGDAPTEHFLLRGDTANNGSTGRLELRCTDITFKDVAGGSTVYVMAGLTNVKAEDSYTQTDLSWITKQSS